MKKIIFLFLLVLFTALSLSNRLFPFAQAANGERLAQGEKGADGGASGMVFVKGGCFEMGDTFGDADRAEKPAHTVCVGDFYIGKYEVTQKQWTEVMGANPSRFKGCGDCPVERVSWYDAQRFINRLGKNDGNKYRLPTEAEWEYAARSGGKKEKYSGMSSDNSLGRYAWYYGNADHKTHPVGKKKPNGLGLYDMTGNVWEWTTDWFDENYYKSSPVNNPQGAPRGAYRVLRGGAWSNYRWYTRASIRDGFNPRVRYAYYGFRLVRGL